MSEQHFRDILGVTETATQEQIKQAYRRLVMENHPDRFPSEKKALQELTTITLTEAYTALMGALTMREEHTPAHAPAKPKGRSPPRSGPGLTAHRDPSYAYYKQGFINFSLAIHGIAEINRKIAAGRVPHFTRRYTAAEDIAGQPRLPAGGVWILLTGGGGPSGQRLERGFARKAAPHRSFHSHLSQDSRKSEKKVASGSALLSSGQIVDPRKVGFLPEGNVTCLLRTVRQGDFCAFRAPDRKIVRLK